MNVEIPTVTSTPVGQHTEVVETPKAPPVETNEGKKEDPQSQESFSKRFAALNRERKAVSQKEIEIKKQMAQIESEKAEIAKWKADQEAIKKGLNPLKALEMHGYKYEDAAQFLLNDEQPTADLKIKSVQDELAELRQKLAEKDREALETEKKLTERQQYEQNQQAKDAIKAHLEKNPDYDALLALNMQDGVFQKIHDHYNATGEVLQINDVAAEMLEQVEKMLSIVTKTNIYKNKFASQTPQKTAPKTLSSAMHAQTAPTERKTQKTDDERIKNALALLSK